MTEAIDARTDRTYQGPPLGQPPIGINDIEIDEDGHWMIKYLDKDGFSAPLIAQYDTWIERILPLQIASRSVRLGNDKRYHFTGEIEFRRPPITPHQAFADSQTYSAPLYVGIGYRYENDEKGTLRQLPDKIFLGNIPVMVGSALSTERGKTATQKLEMGSCPYDAEGYFVINGSEKLILLQEKLLAGRIFTWFGDKKAGAKPGSRGKLTSRMTCVTMTGSQLVLLREGKVGNIRLSLPFFRKDFKKGEQRSVGVLQVFRILGLIMDEIMLERDPEYGRDPRQKYSSYETIIETIESYSRQDPQERAKILLALDSSMLKIYQERDENDYEYMAKKIGISNLPPEIKRSRIIERLLTELFPQISIHTPGIEPVLQKYQTLAMMTARMLEVMAGVRAPDNRDSWGNKRLDSAAIYMQQLFNGLFANYIAKVEESLMKKAGTSVEAGLREFAKDAIITEGFVSSFSSPEWGIRSAYYKENVTDFLKRDNVLSAYSHMRRINVPTSRKAKQQGIRMVHGSSYSFICAAETPEGSACVSSDTPVTMANGTTKRLDELKNGDEVLTIDPKTCQRSVTKIFNHFIKSSQEYGKEVICIKVVSGSEITVTTDHPMLTQFGIVSAGQVDPNLHLLAMYASEKTQNTVGNCVFKQIESITPAPPCMVGDFTTISPNHTFIANGFVTGNCGLVKNLTAVSYISTERDETPIRATLREFMYIKRTPEYSTPCILNGKPLGWCKGQEVYEHLIQMRRTGEVYHDTSIVIDYDGVLAVSCDASRLLRPLWVAGDGKTPLIRQRIRADGTKEVYQNFDQDGNPELSQPGKLIIDQLGLKPDDVEWEDLLNRGCIEYIDPFEQEFMKIAMYRRDVEAQQRELLARQAELETSERNLQQAEQGERVLNANGEPTTLDDLRAKVVDDRANLQELQQSRPYTHAELDPSGIMSVALSVMPIPQHSQGPRLSFCTNMMKQALAISHSHYMSRFETTMKILAYPEKPLFATQTEKIIGLDDMPAGQNAIVAFAPHKGYNQEDAFVFSKTAVELGFGTMIKYIGKRTVLKNTKKFKEILGRPEIRKGDPERRYANISENGLPIIGAYLARGDCVIGKLRFNFEKKTYENISIHIGLSEEGVVEDYNIAPNDHQMMMVKVKIRKVRDCEVGDKFASRTAQKGTIGLMEYRENLPWVAEGPNAGMTPDIITNPLCMPSRMTISKLIEFSQSKLAVRIGKRMNASAFRHFDQDKLRRDLEKQGFTRWGYEKMRSGETGKLLESEIFIAPCYYQALRHQVQDKIQMRATGSVQQLTRQPAGGRMRVGG